MVILIGTGGANSLAGGAASDLLYGRSGSDQLYGGNGNDVISGDAGNDSLFGGSGNDRLFGGSGNDIAAGDLGDDRIEGGSGSDSLAGGGGNDLLIGGSGNDSIDGGSDVDTVVFAGRRATYEITDLGGGIIRVVDRALLADGFDGTDLLRGVEYLRFKDQTVIVEGTANSAPDARDDEFDVDEDGPVDTGNLLASDTDFDDDPLTVTAVNGSGGAVGSEIVLASGAKLTVNADGSYRYDPNGAFEDLGVGDSDTDSFTYTVSDGNGGTDTATVEVTIRGANDAPDAVDDTLEVDAGPSGGPILGSAPPGFGGSLLDNDEDPDGDTLTVTAIDEQDTAVGTLFELASGALVSVSADGSYSYDPNGAFDYLGADESEEDSFTYAVSDGNGGTDTATVSVTVNGVNDDPTADGVHLNIDEADGTYSGNLLDYAADADLNDTLVISAINGTPGNVGSELQIETGAWLTVNADGTFTLDPPRAANSGETLEGSFDYTVSDGNGGFATATVSFTVYGEGVEV